MKEKNNVASQKEKTEPQSATENKTADTLSETEKLIADLEAKAKANLDLAK